MYRHARCTTLNKKWSSGRKEKDIYKEKRKKWVTSCAAEKENEKDEIQRNV